ncbi:TonB-dependent receptor [Parapedobacter deserti]|uniref:TonB-dependent receptor n=2 Tax=Parapedobacter deserti TaxID=1912957 RepID=A0ABV7JIM8_9SPHI
MKLTTLLLIATFLQLSANSYSQTVTLKADRIPLREVLQSIRQQTGYEVLGNTDMLKVGRPVTIELVEASLTDALEQIFAEQPLNFDIDGKTIFLVSSPEKRMNEARTAISESRRIRQQRQVSGTVADETGKPISGVNVAVRNRNTRVVTGPGGNFIITYNNDADTLVFSMVGYRPHERPINGQQHLNVVLQASVDNLDEVVVVGYGRQKRENLTGAVSQVTSDVLENRPATNITQMLQGTMPNVNVTFSGGQPGQGGSINIRGNTSINGGSALVLIDGVAGDINRINPRDVEAISVLKDAAASSIYGARAAYGVILVTTKNAQKGTMSIRYDNNFGWSTPTSRIDYITTGYDAAKLNDDAFMRAMGTNYTGYTEYDYEQLLLRRNDKTEHPDRPWVVIDNRTGQDQYMYYGNWDWWNTVFNKWQGGMDHNLAVQGGTEKVSYLLSGRYHNKDGIMKVNTDKYTIYNFRSKVNANVNDWLTISNNTQFNNNRYAYFGREGGANSNFESIRSHALPSYAPINPDGTAFARTGLNAYAVAVFPQLLQGTMRGEQNNYELNTITNAEIRLGDDWKITGSYAYNLFVGSSFFRGTKTPYSLFPGVLEEVPNYQVDQLKEVTNINRYQAINLYANYTKSFGNHNVNALAGFNQEEQKYKPVTASRMDLLSLTLNDLSLGTGEMMVSGGASEWALRGGFFRVNYDYEGRYLLELAGRYDGTSRFHRDSRFGFFPSFSAGWRISEEPFFQGLKGAVDNLKFRGSYGSLGNQQVATYAYISSMSVGNSTYLINNGLTQFTSAPAPIADSFTWEKATTTNFGIDADFLNRRLSFSIDLYKRVTENMLTTGRRLPSVFGASEPRENAADLETTGFELTLGWNDQIGAGRNRFSYRVNVVLSDYTARITRFDNPTRLLSDFYEGQRLGEIWGYTVDGLFRTDDEAQNYPINQDFVNRQRLRAPGEWNPLRAGDVRFVDLNGDGVVNNGTNTVDDPGDLSVIGNSQPRYAFGINLGASWRGIDFSAFLQGIGRQHWYPGNDAADFWGPYSRPYQSFLPKFFQDDVWSADNPDAYYPVMRGYTALNPNASLSSVNNRYLQDLAYVRLKNLQVGYTLPQNLLLKMKMSGCRIYVSGENLLTFSKLRNDYIDPEMAIANIGMNRVNGINNNTTGNARVYPFSKIFSVGLNLTF